MLLVVLPVDVDLDASSSLSALTVGNAIASASVVEELISSVSYSYVPSVNYTYDVSSNSYVTYNSYKVVSENIYVTQNSVIIDFESSILTSANYQNSDIYLYRYNWNSRSWDYISFTQSPNRPYWSGWGSSEQGHSVLSSSHQLTDHNVPDGWNLYYVFAWSWYQGRWQNDGWMISNWVNVQ